MLIRNEHNPEKMLQHHKQVLKPFDLKNSAQSKLPKELEEFMKPIVSRFLITKWMFILKFLAQA